MQSQDSTGGTLEVAIVDEFSVDDKVECSGMANICCYNNEGMELGVWYCLVWAREAKIGSPGELHTTEASNAYTTAAKDGYTTKGASAAIGVVSATGPSAKEWSSVGSIHQMDSGEVRRWDLRKDLRQWE